MDASCNSGSSLGAGVRDVADNRAAAQVAPVEADVVDSG
jgi:hypothetical protein